MRHLHRAVIEPIRKRNNHHYHRSACSERHHSQRRCSCYERHHPNLEAPAPIDEQEKLFVLVIKPSTPTSLTFSMPHNQQYFNTMLNSKPQFTDAQRSQQARGKPYASKSAGEPYEARAKREQAAQILESLELLVWHSNARNEVC